MRYQATIQWGVSGYYHSTDEISANNLSDLSQMIDIRIGELGIELNNANDCDGDLRGYTPCFANGYPALAFAELIW